MSGVVRSGVDGVPESTAGHVFTGSGASAALGALLDASIIMPSVASGSSGSSGSSRTIVGS